MTRGFGKMWGSLGNEVLAWRGRWGTVVMACLLGAGVEDGCADVALVAVVSGDVIGAAFAGWF